MAGLETIPAIVTPPLNGTGPRARLERALVANVQRSNMHRVEQGYAFKRLADEFGYSIKDISQRVGKSTTQVYDLLQLMELEKEILDLMLELNRKAGTTFIFSTHDRMVMDCARRLVELRDGRVEKDTIR